MPSATNASNTNMQTLDSALRAVEHAACNRVIVNPHHSGGGFSFAFGYYFAFYFSNSTPFSAARQVPHG
jgi:hypothetical protein